VFHVGSRGLGPELGQWNEAATWKNSYGGLADGLFCFAQDLFGVQFAIADNAQLVRFDLETAERTVLGEALADWAAWLLADPDVHAAYRFATAWQDTFGALGHHQRLIPWRFFALGGDYSFDNVVAKDAVDCMRIRGPVAQQLRRQSKGVTVRLSAM
ncbi:MAG: SMI1/KNR4 family protein, partial [Pseudonocardiaceae bacterium]